MKTRMDKGMSRPEYNAWAHSQALASARRDVLACTDNVADCVRRERDTDKAYKALFKAQALLSRLGQG